MLTAKRVGVPVRKTSAACVAVPRTSALSSGAALTSWTSSKRENTLLAGSSPRGIAVTGPGRKTVTMMGNKGSGGIFSPLVVVTRNVVGEKDFNKLRGKAISLHSQVIKDFCKQFGVDNKQVQGVIRLAKKNGEWLGFLA